MYLKFGDLYSGNANYLEISASSGVTYIKSESARSIYFTTNNYTTIFGYSGSCYNGLNTLYWQIASDHRIKENIKKASLKICYDNIKNINLYRFNYIDGFKKGTQRDKTQLGFI
jgi:hypothetical protein